MGSRLLESGTLTYEAVYQLTLLVLAKALALELAGDPINGTNFIEVLEAFNRDTATQGVIYDRRDWWLGRRRGC
jgi:succinyl-CoA synthetase alpha subunit